MDRDVAECVPSQMKTLYTGEVCLLELRQYALEALMTKVEVRHVDLIFNLFSDIVLPLLLLHYLLSCLPFLCLFRILQIDTHQYLIFLESLHRVEVFVIETRAKCDITFIILINVKLSHEFLLSLKLIV